MCSWRIIELIWNQRLPKITSVPRMDAYCGQREITQLFKIVFVRFMFSSISGINVFGKVNTYSVGLTVLQSRFKTVFNLVFFIWGFSGLFNLSILQFYSIVQDCYHLHFVTCWFSTTCMTWKRFSKIRSGEVLV